MLTTGVLDLNQLDQPYVAVIRLATQPPALLFQVTLRPDKVTQGMIRLGETPGDEAAGWQLPITVHIHAILGRAVEQAGKWQCEPLVRAV